MKVKSGQAITAFVGGKRRGFVVNHVLFEGTSRDAGTATEPWRELLIFIADTDELVVRDRTLEPSKNRRTISVEWHVFANTSELLSALLPKEPETPFEARIEAALVNTRRIE